LPQKVIERAKSVLEKLEKYELAVFSEGKTNQNGIENAAQRAQKSKLASQFSLFAISNENVIDEIRDFNIDEISADEAKCFLTNIKKKLI